jgi:hypothetical protein
MKADERLLQLTQREVELLLRYAYPFDAEAAQLRACEPREGWSEVRIGAYWISHWIGDLSYSVRKIRSAALRDELDALCCVLENAERDGAGYRRTEFE